MTDIVSSTRDVTDCCISCALATLTSSIMSKTQTCDDVVYEIEFYVTCDGVEGTRRLETVVFPCNEPYCVTVYVDTSFGCEIPVKVGNTLECTCYPCECGCLEFGTAYVWDGVSQDQTQLIGATAASVNDTIVGLGDQVTFCMTITNNTGGVWVGDLSDGYAYVEWPNCSHLTYISSTGGTYNATGNTPNFAIVRFPLNLGDGETVELCVTWEKECDCTCAGGSFIRFGVVRGSEQESMDIECITCP